MSRQYYNKHQSMTINQSNGHTFELQDKFRGELFQIGLQLVCLGSEAADFSGQVLLVLPQLLDFPIGVRDGRLQLCVLILQLVV